MYGRYTNGGLWRYLIGDTVKFTSFSHRIQISGRTKHYINAFGEELMIDNVETALKRTWCYRSSRFRLYWSTCFLWAKENLEPMNGWLNLPNIQIISKTFSKIFDDTLKSINSDYEQSVTSIWRWIPNYSHSQRKTFLSMDGI